MNYMMLISTMFFISIILLTFNYKHIIMIIMSMEIMMMSLMMFCFMNLMLMKINFWLMFFLIMIVTEGVLALTLLIMMIRFKGMDKMNSLTMIMW
uniref:NADH-ubiquinone oxidoreductase chain 4L n=1 Tax=Aegilips sp. ZJUH 20220002 TaxID=2943451 RepID=A0A9E8GDC8_9HYME|nr:NADH dehydrogenase subunit 4L [Aegilips sp. ZJUH 20220002]